MKGHDAVRLIKSLDNMIDRQKTIKKKKKKYTKRRICIKKRYTYAYIIYIYI